MISPAILFVIGSAFFAFILVWMLMPDKKGRSPQSQVADIIGTVRRQNPLYDAIDQKLEITNEALRKRFIEKLEKDVLEEAQTLFNPPTSTAK